MYKGGIEEDEVALEVFLGAEALVKDSGVAGAEKIVFKKCDAYEGRNIVKMQEKGLKKFPMLYVSIEGQGMERYTREMMPEKLSEFILTKLEETTEEDVFPYSEDLITDQYPVFVKFYEKWCSRCLAMKKAFENAATRMSGRVIFMEVECSSSDLAQEFCTKHDVDGYPTLKLMGGKFTQAILFERDRNVQGFIEFLNEHIPEIVDEEENNLETESTDSVESGSIGNDRQEL
ncbi:hypothetical protein GUITHDRAFT_112488 [Guillardia theta CCMP2712]|uniref:Thioredoxin domain-containing protein n=1 Tax=Guillardia theta (strain CCMP2712) TaxID=905079 RepID=L1J025_GUITC|nr:hypothetical protein GUITHDRAFT_112488 [Guillardia theta CCMP2712]EKX41514.1 hypothetical protein GUITHDRAFT_112488 [Guillardia theta CCMP2712]|eukprot:XP_005828494.1 hypothetical protein GUITHDRAFT_112488 [Guillardia theta CCMP2712]